MVSKYFDEGEVDSTMVSKYFDEGRLIPPWLANTLMRGG